MRLSPFLLLLFLLLSCAPPCDQAMLPALQQYSFMGTKNYSLKDVGEHTELNVVIRSQGEYDKYVVTAADTIRPGIDFSKRMLLIGWTTRGTPDTMKAASIIPECPGYTLNVETVKGNLGVVSKVYYAVVCDRSDKGVKVVIH